MSFELGEALRRCGLETGGRRLILDAMACYTDDETGLCSASQASLAVHAGMSERNAKRLIAALLRDADLAGLVRLVRPAAGRGRVAVYQLMISRVEPLAAAVKAAQRVARAGVGLAMLDAGLCGKPLSPDNMRRAFKLLAALMRAEGHPPAALVVEAQQAVFEAFLASEAPVRRPDGSEPGIDQPGFDFGAESPSAACGKPCGKPDGKGDNLSGKGDNLSSVHIRNLLPSGISTLAPAPREACEFLIAVQAIRAGEFFLDPMAMIAQVTACREDRRAFGKAFAGRMARINPHGALTIFCNGEAEGAELADRWLEPLVAYAASVGLSGVVFKSRARPPPRLACACQSFRLLINLPSPEPALTSPRRRPTLSAPLGPKGQSAPARHVADINERAAEARARLAEASGREFWTG